MLPLLFPPGTLTVGPSLTPSTAFDAASGTWRTTQTVAVGAVNLTDVSFISSAVAALPASTGVRAAHPPGLLTELTDTAVTMTKGFCFTKSAGLLLWSTPAPLRKTRRSPSNEAERDVRTSARSSLPSPLAPSSRRPASPGRPSAGCSARTCTRRCARCPCNCSLHRQATGNDCMRLGCSSCVPSRLLATLMPTQAVARRL